MFGAESPSDAIVRSEKHGQQQLVESSQIPVEGIDNPAFGKTDKDTITPRRMRKADGKTLTDRLKDEALAVLTKGCPEHANPYAYWDAEPTFSS